MKKRLSAGLLVLFLLLCSLTLPAIAHSDSHDSHDSHDSGNSECSSPFTDVCNSGDYYYTPVLWCYENHICYGTSSDSYSPDGTCTRAQAVTFLYRLAGSPEVSEGCPFKDVKATDYFYEAVCWGAQTGVVCGTEKDCFSPHDKVTREQFVSFLYRYDGNPAADSSSAFMDVHSGDYFCKAVCWSSQNGIVFGIEKDCFGTGRSCTRAQAAAFLHRYAVNYCSGCKD